jgi:hypothetical protein
MGPKKRKAGKPGRLADMNAAEPEQPWAPDRPAEGHPYEATFLISEDAGYVQRYSNDEYGRIVEWAVVQMRRDGPRWRRVAVYDICHDKGVHLHLYDREEVQFTETPLRPVRSYQDIDDGLTYALDRVIECWQENERRSHRGY